MRSTPSCSVTDEATVRRLDRDDPIALRVCDQAAIALAFAVLKMRGKCPADVIRLALTGLARTAILVKDSRLGGEARAAWDQAVAKMRGKLESLLR